MPSDRDDDTLRGAIHDRARARAREHGVPFAGELTPAEAWELVRMGDAVLVDVRTHAERDWVGYVPGSLHVEWYDYPARMRNPRFLDDLRDKVPADRNVVFMCRSGARSRDAATLAAASGYAGAYNLDDGFEGSPDSRSRRNTVNGWRFAGLPWRQD